MQIRPILATLRKHRIPAILIVLEIALACAVLCNAVFMISRRVASISLPNAIDEKELISVSMHGADPTRAAADIPRNLAALQGIAGVQAAGVISSLPLSTDNWGWSFGTQPDSVLEDRSSDQNTNVSLYMMAQGTERVLGLRLRQGRFFNADEYPGSLIGSGALPSTHVTVITESLAKKLWPGQSPLGKTIYSKPAYFTVVGVVADVLRPRLFGSDGLRSYHSSFFPMGPDQALANYVLRCPPAERERILREAVQKMQALNPSAVINGNTYEAIRNRYFADTSSMAWMLVLVCAVMLAVTAVGIVGLSSFWVTQRRAQIGIRRALGATRGDILRYFQLENFLLVGIGILLGMLLAYGINLFLMAHYELPRLPMLYLPAGALALWLIGQGAVLGPAQRAAAVPPVVATRAA